MLLQVSGCCSTDTFENMSFCFYTDGAYLSKWPLPILDVCQVMHDAVVTAHIFAQLRYTNRWGFNFWAPITLGAVSVSSILSLQRILKLVISYDWPHFHSLLALSHFRFFPSFYVKSKFLFKHVYIFKIQKSSGNFFIWTFYCLSRKWNQVTDIICLIYAIELLTFNSST
jgi:hypothetical protein